MNRQQIPEELELRHRLGQIENQLKEAKDSKRNQLIREHQRIVKFLGEDVEINSAEDVKDYNSRSLSKAVKPELN